MTRRRSVVGLAALVALVVLRGADDAGGTLRAQSERPQASPVAHRAVRFASTPPVRSMPPPEVFKGADATLGPTKAVPIKAFRTEGRQSSTPFDAAVQLLPPRALLAPQPSRSFDGLTFRDDLALFGLLIAPPDTVGDVGPGHYVQMVNSAFRIYDKTGTALGPARKLSSLWASLDGPCAARDDGDPIVLYDSVADRWLLSQFCTVGDPTTHQLIAISQTPDPTGAYYVYDFPMPNEKFNDYPKFGVWNDAFYMTCNQFDQAGSTYLGAGVFAFDRARMLAGDPSASYVYVDLAPVDMTIGGLLPADLDGLTPPPAGTPGLLAYFTADEFGDPADGLRLFDFRVDFHTPSASTLLERPESPLAVASFNPLTPPGRDDIRQPSPATDDSALDAISDRLMHRFAYRNSGREEWLVVTHTVNAGGTTDIASFRAGVRYYNVRRTTGGSFHVSDQATYAPDGESRWMGSAATDHQGNLAVGYSVASTTTFPSIRYAGRLTTDLDGGLYQGEATVIEGGGSQTSTGSRWGDYSALVVDPVDDCTFWYTNQYYTTESQGVSVGWLTRIGTFTFAECTPVSSSTVRGTVRDALAGQPVPGALVRSATGHLAVADQAGVYALRISPGVVDLTASATAYASTGGATVDATAGGTTTRDLFLLPVPAIEAGEASVQTDTCGLRTGGIDPGELVTVMLAVVNRGKAATDNLVGTLLASGGVVRPDGPHEFGAVPANGMPVARAFTFIADASLGCGANLTASLELRDGARALGVVTYAFTTGLQSNAAYPTVASSGDLAQQIPDVGQLDVPFAIDAEGVVGDVEVSVRLDHSFDADLVIELVHPDGTVIKLSNRHGGDGGFGTGSNDCSGSPTLFSDEAVTAIADAQSPFAGSVKPDMPLAGLRGKAARGTWYVRVKDTAAEDTGTLGCVTLTLRRRLMMCCPYGGHSPAAAPAGPAAVRGESCGNGAADPEESVTVSFPLHNVGDAPLTKLVATLLAGGGVNAPSAARSYGPLDPAGPSESREFTFVPSGTCGSDITATLALEDVAGAGPLGTVSFPLRLGTLAVTTHDRVNAQPSLVPRVSTSGPAEIYPSTISVSGVTGTVTRVVVRVEGLTHTYPDDLDLLLVGPGGQRALLMSDAGGPADLNGVTLVFDDEAEVYPPDGGPVIKGIYRPANYGTGDALPAPAPPGPYAEPQLLSVFKGIDPNGTWSLYVSDDGAQDVGRFTGWGLTLSTTAPSCCRADCRLVCPSAIESGVDQDSCSATVPFEPVVSGSCGAVTCTPASGAVFDFGTTFVSCESALVMNGAPTASCRFPVGVTHDGSDPTSNCGSAAARRVEAAPVCAVVVGEVEEPRAWWRVDMDAARRHGAGGGVAGPRVGEGGSGRYQVGVECVDASGVRTRTLLPASVTGAALTFSLAGPGRR